MHGVTLKDSYLVVLMFGKSFSSRHPNVTVLRWRPGLWMAWQQRAIAILKLTCNMLQSPCNMFKQSFWCQNLGQLTMLETFFPNPHPLAISQTPCWLQTFLQGLWSKIWVTSSCMQAAFMMTSRITAIPPPACLSHFLSYACHNRPICTVL
jgi:hypothetical protein